MKLQFKSQDFQTAAVHAVTDLFAGQEHTRAVTQKKNVMRSLIGGSEKRLDSRA